MANLATEFILVTTDGRVHASPVSGVVTFTTQAQACLAASKLSVANQATHYVMRAVAVITAHTEAKMEVLNG